MGKYSPETITMLSTIMKQLSEGKDPTSGLGFPEDSILNSNILKKAFADTSDILNCLVKGVTVKPHKLPFTLTDEEMKMIPISEEPQPISRFVFTINDTVFHPDMRKLYAKQITEKLTELHYLKRIFPEDSREYKIATKLGESLGIRPVHKTNLAGNHYVTNLYDADAQRFIIYEIIPLLQKDLLIIPE